MITGRENMPNGEKCQEYDQMNLKGWFDPSISTQGTEVG